MTIMNAQQEPNVTFPVPLHLSTPSSVHSDSVTLVASPSFLRYAADLEKNQFAIPASNSLQLADVPQPSTGDSPKIENETSEEILALDKKLHKRKVIWRTCIVVFWVMTLAGLIWAAAGGATLPSIVFLVISAVMAGLSCCVCVLFC